MIKPISIPLAIALLFLCYCTNAYADDEDIYKYWGSAQVKGSLDKGFKYWLEVQPRLNIDRAPSNDVLLRAALGKEIRKNWSFWLGYDATPSFLRNSERTVIIQSPWQQIKFSLPRFDGHIRLEERFRRNQPKTAYRLRNKITPTLPKNIHFGHWSPVISEEIFLNLNKPVWVSRKTVSENRLLFGLKRDLSETESITLGYMFRNLWQSELTIYEHILYMALEFSV